MVTEFPHLFTPGRLGAITVRNRLVWTAHDTNLAERHLPSREHAAYYEARARGGVGLIVMEANSVHPTAEIHGACVHAYDPASVDGYRRIADAVHGCEAQIVVQMAHQGTHMTFHKNLTPAWAPSAVPSVVEREIPHVVTQAEIGELVESYTLSAHHAVEGGMDGVEISASHSYLPAQFLSPWYNRRTDEYGGDLEGRMRFLREILKATRAAIGDRVIGVRISGEELTSFGMQVEDAVAIAQALERDGQADYLSVSIGSMHTRTLIVPPMVMEHGYQLPTTEKVRSEVGLPLMAVGRIVDPATAEQVLAAGTAHYVGMTRAQIADPELAEKARTGRVAEIRPCIGCNQVCRERFFLGKTISCTVNPAAGRELLMPALAPATDVLRVQVVGGGPAGLHVAAGLAALGHDVELHEQSDELGGQARLAARLPGRAEIARSVAHLASECVRLGVELRLGSRVEAVDGDACDCIVLATGSSPRRWPFPEYGTAAGQPAQRGAPVPFLTVWEAVEGAVEGERLLVVDEMGRYEGVGVAELLAERGHAIAVASTQTMLAPRLVPTGDHSLILTRLLERGVTLYPQHRVAGFGDRSVTLVNALSDRLHTQLDGIDGIVWSCGNRAADALADRDQARSNLYLAGDCVAPRSLDEAFYEAEQVVRAIATGSHADRVAEPTSAVQGG